MGYCPARSPNAAPSLCVMSCTAAMISLVLPGPLGRMKSSSSILMSSNVTVLGRVDCVPCLDWFKWPKLLSMDFGRCFLTSSSVRPGNVLRNPLFIAGNNVLGAGLPRDS